MPGHYLMTERGRGGYQILGFRDRGRRGGLGRAVYRLIVFQVVRVPRAEAEGGPVFLFNWDPRQPRRRAS